MSPTKINTTFKLSQETREDLAFLAEKEGLSQAALIARLVIDYKHAVDPIKESFKNIYSEIFRAAQYLEIKRDHPLSDPYQDESEQGSAGIPIEDTKDMTFEEIIEASKELPPSPAEEEIIHDNLTKEEQELLEFYDLVLNTMEKMPFYDPPNTDFLPE
ncbi:MAG: CopG family transcriptional regulator [Bacteroidota bacterium]